MIVNRTTDLGPGTGALTRKLGLFPPTDYEISVMRIRWGDSFKLLRQFGDLVWRGTLAPLGREWHVKVPYPLRGAMSDPGVEYPRVQVIGLPPSPHRIGDFLCLFDPDDPEPGRRWEPAEGVPRLVEMTCIWLDTYERWLRLPPSEDGFPAWMFGATVFGVRVDESRCPPWPGLEAPHGRRKSA